MFIACQRHPHCFALTLVENANAGPSEQQNATSAGIGITQEVETPVVAAMPFRRQTAQPEAPLSVAALMARMHKLRHMG